MGAADRFAFTLRQAPNDFLLVGGQPAGAAPVDAVGRERQRVVVVAGDPRLDLRRPPFQVQQVAQPLR
jgi:hypothetical protein